MVTIKDLGVGGWSSHRLFQTGLGGPGQGRTVSSHTLPGSRIRFRHLTKEAGPMRVLGRATYGLWAAHALFSDHSDSHTQAKSTEETAFQEWKEKEPIQKGTARHIHTTNTSLDLLHSAFPQNWSSNKLSAVAKAFTQKLLSDNRGVSHGENV